MPFRHRGHLFIVVGLGFLIAGCVRPDPGAVGVPTPDVPTIIAVASASPQIEPAATYDRATPITAALGTPLVDYTGTPTPDAPHHKLLSDSGEFLTHTVLSGETLGIIAQEYTITLDELIILNDIANPDLLEVGQELILPGELIEPEVGPDTKLIPDSELVYGPGVRSFDQLAFVETLNGRLLSYSEEVEGRERTGPEILTLVAERNSINPRLLLAVLEHRTGWVIPGGDPLDEPLLGYHGPRSESLYVQLSWAANHLNQGFYGRSEGGLRSITVADRVLFFDPTINDATAGIQVYLAADSEATYESWLADSGASGLQATYTSLFGNPFALATDPLWPATFVAPELMLPWPEGETWYFTSGPHGAWNSGSAWGALDFAPPAEQLGCVASGSWVTAMADGLVTRSSDGAVVVDLDGDGDPGTGWAITYMHLETRDRVASGTEVTTGDKLGHPSCEGGVSNGTHVHVVRSYNGRWVSADGSIPFVINGWTTQGAGVEYNGFLVKGDQVVEACACRDEELNAVPNN